MHEEVEVAASNADIEQTFLPSFRLLLLLTSKKHKITILSNVNLT